MGLSEGTREDREQADGIVAADRAAEAAREEHGELSRQYEQACAAVTTAIDEASSRARGRAMERLREIR